MLKVQVLFFQFLKDLFTSQPAFNKYPVYVRGFSGGSVVKSPPANAEDMGSIPGLGRYPGGGNGNPSQYSYLGNLLERGAW